MIPHDRWPHDGPPGIRLDKALAARYPWLSRAQVAALLDSRRVLLGGRPAPKGAKLSAGALLEATGVPEPSDLRLQPNPSLPLHVVWEDDWLLALDKPAGMPTHPLRADETDTLANALVARFPELAGIGNPPLFPAMLHRLDTGTSGLVLAAKTQAVFRSLRETFRRLEVEKHYLAWVHGDVAEAGRCDAPLTHQTRSPCRMRPLAPGENVPARETFPASTVWTPLRHENDRTLLDVTIRTGVTHQIRCHLAAAGHPVVGDRIYGPPTGLPRHLLHAHTIRLVHPASSAPLMLAVPPPEEFGWNDGRENDV